MSKFSNLPDEAAVQALAKTFVYPPTPDIASRGQQPVGRVAVPRPARRLVWGLVLLGLLAGLLAVPGVRAAVVQAIRAGAIFIFSGDVAPTETRLPPLSEQILAFTTPLTVAEAQARFPSLKLPTRLGQPDDVLLHEANGEETAVIFLWRNPQAPEQLAWSLYQIHAGNYAYKRATIVAQTQVAGQEAFWVEGPHYFLFNDEPEPWLFVEGPVLIWWAGSITYRLEGAATLAEAIEVAESLQAVGSE